LQQAYERTSDTRKRCSLFILIFISASLEQKTLAEQAHENSELLKGQEKSSNKSSCNKMYESNDIVGP